jgi:hypothetical protein
MSPQPGRLVGARTHGQRLQVGAKLVSHHSSPADVSFGATMHEVLKSA